MAERQGFGKRLNMVESGSLDVSKGLQKSSSKNNLAAMAGANYSGSTGLLNKPSPKKQGAAPALLKRSRSMGTFGHYVNFGQQAVEDISGKTSIGATAAPASVPVPASIANQAPGSLPMKVASAGAPSTPVVAPVVVSNSPSSTESPSQGSDAAAPPSPAASDRSEDTPELVDDNNLHYVPMARVDYFSHEWSESDLAGSWRYIVSRRQDMANSARLENASWRTWAKAKYKLKTVQPETVNWLKDYDVTWLYGPLYHERSSTEWDRSEAGTSQTPETVMPKTETGKRADSIKSILKKKTIAEIMLEDSPDYKGPTDNYLRHHNYRHVTDDQQNIAKVVNIQYSIQQPQQPEDRHVHFNVRVEQCIALDPEEQQPHDDNHHNTHHDMDSDSEDSESEEGGLFLGIQRNSGSSVSTSRTIAPLPATTLNTPDDEEQELSQIKGSRNYDYNSVYTCTTPEFKIVDPKIQAVQVPANVATAINSSSSSSDIQSVGRKPNVSFGM